MAQEGTTIKGKVTDAAGNPLPGANVFIELTNLGAATDHDGSYSFTVPAKGVKGQEVRLTARMIGFRTQTEKLTLRAGTMEKDFNLAGDVLNLDAIIVTGVVEATPREKLAFSVGTVNQQVLELVPATSPEIALQGKIPGVKVVKGSGEPGNAASVQLRAPTSINADGRSQDPLYIVDGIIIDPSVSGSPLADINADDIESMEVVKGAAGASLYGARAANGVVNIKTARGSSLGLNETRIKVRNEIGFNQLPRELELNKSHHFRILNRDTTYTDANGHTVTRGDFINAAGHFVDPRAITGRLGDRYTTQPQGAGIFFSDKPFKYVGTGEVGSSLVPLPSGGFNHMDRFFDPGTYLKNSISISRNTAVTNFAVSFDNHREDGVVTGLNAFERRSLRVNLDHKFYEKFQLGVSGFYSSSRRDDIPNNLGAAFFGLTFMARDADLTLRDATGELYVRPDPTSVEENPLYVIEREERGDSRKRVLGNISLRYNPVDWFSLESNLSYDRSDRNFNLYYPVGYQTIGASPINTGQFYKNSGLDEALNGNIVASLSRRFGELTLRTKAQGLFERAEFNFVESSSTDLRVSNVRDLGLGDPTLNSDNSALEQIRSDGFSLIAAADFRDRYIADFLIRRDGSSLFGNDERWHTYYRASGAYRLSLEPWWFLKDAVEELKLRASYGTAGGRPNFFARYETWSVVGGGVRKGNRGNTELKPEFARELELGVDMAFLKRFSLEFTRAKSIVEEQILFVPLPAFVGYQNEWKNAGTLETSTYELGLQASLLNSRNFTWTAGLNFDRTRQMITKLNPGVPPYVFAPPGTQDLAVFFINQGEEFGALYGARWIKGLNELPAGIPQDQFQVNDDGYVVWVGAGNSYQDGLAKTLWGTRATIRDANGVNRIYVWGMPIKFDNGTTNPLFNKIGSIVPDFNLAFNTSFRWKNLSVYTLLDAQIGGDVYNMTNQWGMREWKLADADQAGKPEGLKKPTTYYSTLYDTRGANSHFVEDATYLKIREVSLRYTFNQPALRGVFGNVLSRLTLGVVGRNLFTFTDYSAYDPEVGIAGGQGGSSALARFDSYGYPNFRTVSGVVELEF
jgi:TonB-linked SusC/RagA family outer membrane protein